MSVNLFYSILKFGSTIIEMLKEGFDIEVISKIMKKPVKDIITVKEINNL